LREPQNRGIVGVGIDLVKISRIARAYRRRPDRFLNRIFSRREVELLQRKKKPLASMAARFAAKEAVSKALGCGIGTVSWKDMEILFLEGGRPVVLLSGAAARWAEAHGIGGVAVSMAHDDFYAVAKAVAFG